MKPVLGSEKAKIWQEQALRASDETPKSTRNPPPRSLTDRDAPGRCPPVAGARWSWRPEAAPKNTARRVCGTRPQMRHAERARKPSSFLKSVHYNKSYASETPMKSIEFTAINGPHRKINQGAGAWLAKAAKAKKEKHGAQGAGAGGPRPHPLLHPPRQHRISCAIREAESGNYTSSRPS